MGRGDENSTNMMKSTSLNGAPMEGVKFTKQAAKSNRRRLGDIGNIIGHPPYPSIVKKSEVVIDAKNPHGFVGRRPITRKFAASLVEKSQACNQDTSAIHDLNVSEGVQKPTESISSSNCSNAIEVDDYESTYDFPLAMIEEIEEMVQCDFEEVEMKMEDIVVDPIVDIDRCDSKNPLAVVDYVEDIYRFYREIEELGCVCPNYMSIQFDMNEKMRAIVIDWLVEVHYKFGLMDETLFLTVNLIDRFLSRQSMSRRKLQLIGATAMLLACKYEEPLVPVVEDLIIISDGAFTKAEVLEMERLMVNILQFNLFTPTPCVFMKRFLKAAQSDKKLELLSFFLVELCLVEYQMLKFRPSCLSAAAVYTAQCTLKGFKHWSRTCELHSTYTEKQLQECSRMIVELHQNAGTRKLTSVYKKYSTFKFGFSAKTEPALFLLDAELDTLP